MLNNVVAIWLEGEKAWKKRAGLVLGATMTLSPLFLRGFGALAQQLGFGGEDPPIALYQTLSL